MAYSSTVANLIANAAGALTTWESEFDTYSEAQQKKSTAIVLAMANRANSGTEVLTAADTLTADESGKTYFLNTAGGFTVTLPAAAAGLRYTFIVKTAPTTAYILLAGTADTISSRVYAGTGGDEDFNALGDQINFVANTSLVGDRVELFSDGSLWYAYGFCEATGSITCTG